MCVVDTEVGARYLKSKLLASHGYFVNFGTMNMMHVLVNFLKRCGPVIKKEQLCSTYKVLLRIPIYKC